MTSSRLNQISEKSFIQLPPQNTLTFQINEYIQFIYNKHSLGNFSDTSKEGLNCTIQILKVMPYHVKVKSFEHLGLDHLVKILKINQDSFENIEVVSAAKQVIQTRLKNFLPKELFEDFKLEDILDLLQKLYNVRKNDIYRKTSLESFNNVENFTAFIELLEKSPLIMLEIFKEFLFREVAIIEVDSKLILKWGFIFWNQTNRYGYCLLKQIFTRCLLICVKSNNIKMLNLFNLLELENFLNENQPEFWLLLKQNYSKNFVKKLLEILFGYPTLNIQDPTYELSALRKILFLLMKVSDFNFIKEILIENPDILKNDSCFLSEIDTYIRKYVKTMGDQTNHRSLLLELFSIQKLLS